LSWVVLVDVGFMHHDARIALFPWITSGDLQVGWSLRVDFGPLVVPSAGALAG